MIRHLPGATPAYAIAALIADPVRFGGLILGIAFATLLIVQQLSVFLGVMDLTRSTILDADGIHAWVIDPRGENLSPAALRQADAERVASVAGVARASVLMQRSVRVRSVDRRSHDALLHGIDPATLDGLPAAMAAGAREDLRQPESVLVDAESAAGRLAAGPGRPLRTGDRIEIAGRLLAVAGIVRCRRNFNLQPVLFASHGLAAELAPAGLRQAELIAVRLRPGADPGAVCSAIAAATGLRALPSAGFADLQYGWVLRNTGIPMNFAISVALGFIVGVAVAGLLFNQFVGDQLRFLAVLRALGARRRVVLATVATQAVAVGALGYGFGVGAAALFHRCVQGTALVSQLTPALLAVGGAAVAAIVLAVAVLGAWRAVRVDPAAVFRS